MTEYWQFYTVHHSTFFQEEFEGPKEPSNNMSSVWLAPSASLALPMLTANNCPVAHLST